MKSYSLNTGIIFIIVTLLFITTGVRLFHIQVIKGEEYSQKVERLTRRRIVLQPLRGMILARDGQVLARALHRKAVVQVAEDSSTLRLNRIYPYGRSAASILGFIDPDGNGIAGVEFSCDSLLKGEAGWTVLQVNGHRQRFGGIGVTGSPAIDGYDVRLTIDLEVQKILERELIQAVEDHEAKSATGIVMDPRSGEIIAVASMPNYNANYYWEFPRINRRNRAVEFNYEPGSTMKVLTLASVLDAGIMGADDSIDANQGRYEVYDEVIRDHTPRGMMSLQDALAYSSNVAFAKLADTLGMEQMFSYMRDFGFGTRSGIRLGGEARGILHPLEDWDGRTCVTMSFGHAVSTTLLQMTTAFSAVANGGYLLQPRIVRSVHGEDGVLIEETEKTVIRSVISPEVARQVREMMEGVVEYGTARKIKQNVVPWCGKTGTSEKIDAETGAYDREAVWSSFIGMAPVEKPVVVVAVVVDDPVDVASGGKAAAPAVASIIEKIVATPNLSIGEEIMLSRGGEYNEEPREITVLKYPELTDLTRREAGNVCKVAGIEYEFVNDGEIVTHQSPEAGGEVLAGAPVLLYTNPLITSDEEESIAVMPSCVGRTMKDAINALSIKGLTPSFEGYGNVIGQKPTAGTVVTVNQPCTLYCDIREVE